MADVTITDLVQDWRIRRDALSREITFWESRPGLKPALPIRALRLMALRLDRLIARYSHDA